MKVTEADVGRTVRAQRAAQGLSLTETSRRLAEAGHPIHHDALTRMERGVRHMRVGDLLALADVFGVEAADLLRGVVRVVEP